MLKSLSRPLMAAGLLTSVVAVHAQTPPVALPQPVAVLPIPAAFAPPPPAGDSVVIELRVISVGGDTAGKLFAAKDDMACCEAVCDPKSAKPKPVFLTAEQMKGWLDRVQADRTCTVMAAPKVTVSDGQTANVAIQDVAKFTTGVDVRVVKGNTVMVPKTETVELGTTFRVTGTLSADRKSVKLGLDYRNKELASPHVPLHPVTTMVTPVFEGGSQGTPVPFTQFIQHPTFRETAVETTALLPDGGAVALHAGKKTVQLRSEFGPPVISQIPYLNRLFKNTGLAEVEQDVVVLATARRMPDPGVKTVTYVVHPIPNHQMPSPTQAVYVVPAGATVARAAAPAGDDLTALLSAYRVACAAGKKDEAARLAVQALAKDPTCFAGSK
jgi:predicted RNA-binding protein with TRAM domain